ncbi:MAG: hypothetical protein VST68_02180 [Nitrospirota bacterium]|nr:hypothetical protein [Nitrospirota bacterium]
MTSHTEEEEMNQRRHLLALARKGDQNAVGKLMELYQVRVYSGENLRIVRPTRPSTALPKPKPKPPKIPPQKSQASPTLRAPTSGSKPKVEVRKSPAKQLPVLKKSPLTAQAKGKSATKVTGKPPLKPKAPAKSRSKVKAKVAPVSKSKGARNVKVSSKPRPSSKSKPAGKSKAVKKKAIVSKAKASSKGKAGSREKAISPGRKPKSASTAKGSKRRGQ